jgi:hypothetical protein
VTKCFDVPLAPYVAKSDVWLLLRHAPDLEGCLLGASLEFFLPACWQRRWSVERTVADESLGTLIKQSLSLCADRHHNTGCLCGDDCMHLAMRGALTCLADSPDDTFGDQNGKEAVLSLVEHFWDLKKCLDINGQSYEGGAQSLDRKKSSIIRCVEEVNSNDQSADMRIQLAFLRLLGLEA